MALDPQARAVLDEMQATPLSPVAELEPEELREAFHTMMPEMPIQVLIYPVTDYAFDTPSYRENAEGYLLTRDLMRWFWGHYLERESDGAEWRASPLRAPELSGLPPALVITAEHDPLRDAFGS